MRPVAARILVLTLWIASLAGPVCAQEDDSNDSCFDCHDEEEMTVEFDDGESSAWVESSSFSESAHGRLACTECHRQVDLDDHPSRELPAKSEYRTEMARECERCHTSSSAAEERFAPVIAGLIHPVEADFLCVDCHGSHTMKPGAGGSVEISRQCVDCHDDAASALAASVHGDDVHGPDCPDLPVCASCHEGHAKPGRPEVAMRVRLSYACRQCHGNEEIAARHGLSPDVVDTYLADFHGATLKLYEKHDHDIKRNVLVCADCHGTHAIRPVTKANAVAMKKELVEVCRGCHADVAADFPNAWLSHYPPSLVQNPLVFLVKTAYWILIPFVIVGLTLQIIFHLVVMPIRKRSRGGKVEEAEPPEQEGVDTRRIPNQFVRFNRRQRLDHLLGLVTFALLVLTGIPQKFHTAEWAESLVVVLGGIDVVRLIHRGAGVVFTTVMIPHLFSAIRGVLQGKSGMSIVPNRKDFTDVVHNLGYYLGIAKDPPKFDRFDYRQKFEYWGMILGSTIMVVTGFTLFFPTWFVQFLPAQFIPAAKVAHSFEAMMALLTIVVWHMYSVVLDPEARPLDTSIFTGKISRERMRQCHPLEYERMVQKIARVQRDVSRDTGRSSDASAEPALTPRRISVPQDSR